MREDPGGGLPGLVDVRRGLAPDPGMKLFLFLYEVQEKTSSSKV